MKKFLAIVLLASSFLALANDEAAPSPVDTAYDAIMQSPESIAEPIASLSHDELSILRTRFANPADLRDTHITLCIAGVAALLAKPIAYAFQKQDNYCTQSLIALYTSFIALGQSVLNDPQHVEHHDTITQEMMKAQSSIEECQSSISDGISTFNRCIGWLPATAYTVLALKDYGQYAYNYWMYRDIIHAIDARIAELAIAS